MKKNKEYQRMLNFATGFNRFALLLIRSSFLDVRKKWLEQLTEDLKKENIRVVHIQGDFCKKDSEKSITSIIQKHIPGKEVKGWVLSLSPDDLKGKASISSGGRPTFLVRLNFERDSIIKAFPVPVIIWGSSFKAMAEHAPDFFDFRQFIIELPNSGAVPL